MDNIILYLLHIIQAQYQQICWLILFICRYIPLRQWAHDQSHSPKYQKFAADELPVIKTFHKQDWRFLLEYYLWKYGKPLMPVKRRNGDDMPRCMVCPVCDAPHEYIRDNNGGRGQYKCKVCGANFVTGEKLISPLRLYCPHCSRALALKKNRSCFRIHKCVNLKCPFYLRNLKNVEPADLARDYGKNDYKLHYIYREFTIDFFKMALDKLPNNISSLRFTRHNAHIMGLCLTYHVNHQVSLRKTARLLLDVHGINISHQQVANYARIAALCIKPFVDNYDYDLSGTDIGDETYIKIRGVRHFVWFIIDAASRAVIGYQVSHGRGVGPCIMAMRMAFRKLTRLPGNFRFIADGYSAYVLAAQQFSLAFGDKFRFDVTQVLGLTNDDAVSREFRPYKQMVERLNRTFKASYRVSCGYGNMDGANYNVALWVAYYNFLRPHKHHGFKPINRVEMIEHAGNMPGKWQLLIYLGQKTILHMQGQSTG